MNVLSVHDVADKIGTIDLRGLELKAVFSKCLKLWPRDDRFELLYDHWCCRFMSKKEGEVIEPYCG